jgi:hypothetical protein
VGSVHRYLADPHPLSSMGSPLQLTRSTSEATAIPPRCSKGSTAEPAVRTRAAPETAPAEKIDSHPPLQPRTVLGLPSSALVCPSSVLNAVAVHAYGAYVAPHVLHHIGLLAGTALVAGAAGTTFFGLLGLVAAIPLLLRLKRRFGPLWHPL